MYVIAFIFTILTEAGATVDSTEVMAMATFLNALCT